MRKLMKQKVDLTTGPILRKLLIVAIPTLLTSLVQMTYNLTDMFWVGKVDRMGLVPTEAIAAVGTVGYFPWFGMGLIMLIKLGSSVHISQMAGKNDTEGIKKIGNTGFVLMLGVFILYMLFGVFFTDFYVGLFKLDNANVVIYATDYMRIISLFGFSYFLTNFWQSLSFFLEF